MLSVAKHLFPMVCIEILRFAQNDRFADCVISNEREISLLPLFEILRFAQDEKFSADKTPSPFGYSLYKQRESFACLFWDSSASRSG